MAITYALIYRVSSAMTTGIKQSLLRFKQKHPCSCFLDRSVVLTLTFWLSIDASRLVLHARANGLRQRGQVTTRSTNHCLESRPRTRSSDAAHFFRDATSLMCATHTHTPVSTFLIQTNKQPNLSARSRESEHSRVAARFYHLNSLLCSPAGSSPILTSSRSPPILQPALVPSVSARAIYVQS